MEICFVNQDMSLGGSSTVLYEIIKNWPNKKDSLSLIVFYDLFDERYLDLFNLSYLKIYILNKTKTIDFKFLKVLKKTIFDIKPNVISSHLTCVFYLRLVGAAKICNIYHTIHSEPINDLPKIYRLLIKRYIKKDKIKLIGCCDYVTKKAIQLYNHECLTIRNGIDLSCKHPRTESNQLRFLFVGRLCEVKNVVEIVESFNNVDGDFVLNICGSGSEEYTKLVTQTISDNKNSDKIHLFGNQQDIEAIYSKSDILILVSKREGMPMVLFEGAKYGLGFITTDVGSISEVVTPNINGYFVKDFSELTDKLNLLIFNKELVNDFKKNSLKICSNFGASVMAKKYYEVLKNG